MPKILWTFVLAALLLPVPLVHAGPPAKDPNAITVGPHDWPWWRGPQRNGVADANPKPPLKWSETENVLWKTPVPGRGHGSPIVVGDQVFLPTAETIDNKQSVLCYERNTGKLLWQTEIHRGGAIAKGANTQSSLASGTMACDGERVFVNFLHDNAIYTTALSRAGKQLWQTRITGYVLHQGFGSSPAVYKSLVIVSADNKGTGVIAGLERTTGKIVWKEGRPEFPNYASPVILKVAGRDQLFFIGCKLVTSLDPLTGKKLWEMPGSTTECVTSTVTDGKLMVTSGGFPTNHVAAVTADGTMKTVWEHKVKVYVPSLLQKDGYLYAVQDAGVAVCWKFDTGKEMWKARLGPDKSAFTASPVLVGDLIYAINEAGRTFIYKANPKAFELIAENQLANDAMATPTICGGRIYMRVAVRQEEQRQEMLYCIGKRD